MEIIFLGTGGSIPTRSRNLPSIALRFENEVILFDCGEGTQKQMMAAHVGFNRPTKILISHLHGDHIGGIIGLIQTMSLLRRERKLEIYGPPGIREFINSIMSTVKFTLNYPIDINEVHSGLIYSGKKYVIEALETDHSVMNLAYALIEHKRPGKFYPDKAQKLGIPKGPLWSKLQRGFDIELPNGRIIKPEMIMGPPRPGRKFVYTGDTRPTEKLVDFAKNADVLVFDSTFDDRLMNKAVEEGHSTPSLAANIAKKANVRTLILFHISPRYKNTRTLLTQARRIFPNTFVAKDLWRFQISYSD